MENNAEMHGSRYDAMVKQLEAQRAEKMKSAPAEDSPEAKEIIAADIQKFDPTGEELHKLVAGDNVPEKETPKEPEQKQEQQTPTAEEVNKGWRDRLKETPEFKEKQMKAQQEEMLAKMKELEEFEKSELYGIMQRAKKEGKNPLDLLKEVNQINVESMSEEELVKYEAQKHNLTEDEIEEEFNAFQNKTPLEKRKYLNAIREQLKSDNEAIKKKFEPSAPAENKLPEEILKKAEKAQKSLNDILDNLDGKEYVGVKFTPNRLSKVEETVQKLVNASVEDYLTDDGELDMIKAVEHAVIINFNSRVIADAEKRAYEQGKMEMAKERHNPSKYGFASNRAPGMSKSDEEIRQELVDKEMMKFNPRRYQNNQ